MDNIMCVLKDECSRYINIKHIMKVCFGKTQQIRPGKIWKLMYVHIYIKQKRVCIYFIYNCSYHPQAYSQAWQSWRLARNDRSNNSRKWHRSRLDDKANWHIFYLTKKSWNASFKKKHQCISYNVTRDHHIIRNSVMSNVMECGLKGCDAIVSPIYVGTDILLLQNFLLHPAVKITPQFFFLGLLQKVELLHSIIWLPSREGY